MFWHAGSVTSSHRPVHGVAARSAELSAAAEELAASSAAQEGCVSFEVLVPCGADADLVLVSAWRSVIKLS